MRRAGYGLDCIEGLSIYGPLLGERSILDCIVPTRYDHLFMVPADLDLAGAEIEVARFDDHLTRLRTALDPLRKDVAFDWVLMDHSPSLGILMTNALAAADELLVPIQCEYFALEGLSKIVRVIQQIQQSGANPGLESWREPDDDVCQDEPGATGHRRGAQAL